MKEIYAWGIFTNFLILTAAYIFILNPMHPLYKFLWLGACAAVGIKLNIIFWHIKRKKSKNKYKTTEFRLSGKINVMDEIHLKFDFDVPGLLFNEKPTKQDCIQAIDDIVTHWLLSNTDVSWDVVAKEENNEKSVDKQTSTKTDGKSES
jgi:hypothetical protein